MLWLSPPVLTGTEQSFVNQALDSGWIAPNGPATAALELQLSQFLSVDELLLVSSGTAALHLALLALGIGAGDEVLCPTNTFAGSIFPVIYTGATPVFVEVNPDTWTISVDWLQEALVQRRKAGANVKAVLAVDLYGMPCDYQGIIAFCNKNELRLIVDAAESFGAMYGQKATIGLGDAGILSFNGNKIITTSGGGALYLSDPERRTLARRLANQAKQPVPYYLHQEVGYNYRLSNISAAIGLAQLPEIHNRIQKKRIIFERYLDGIAQKSSVKHQVELSPAFSNRWLSVFYFLDKNFSSAKITQLFANEQIEVRPAWKPMHEQPIFQQYLYFGNSFSSRLFQQGLCFPSGINLTESQQIKVIELLFQFENK